METPTDNHPLSLGLIRIQGSDASSFLRAQLSNDVDRLAADAHFLAAWCDAKGRTTLVVRVIARPDAFWLLAPRPLLDTAIQRLRMFVLRLDVRIDDISDQYVIVGRHDIHDAPPLDQARTEDSRVLLGLPGSEANPERSLLIQPVDDDRPDDAMTTDSDKWILSDIDAGIPQVSAATQNTFVPQMLNLHWLMGIDFGKGCYPGQEVIARLQYRGRLTRRVFRYAWQGRCPQPGETVQDDKGSPQGQILQAVGDETGRALAVVQVDAAARDRIQTDAASLQGLTLPYPTDD